MTFEEVGTFKEVAACGTAVVLTPVQTITRGKTIYKFPSFDTIAKLYKSITQVYDIYAHVMYIYIMHIHMPYIYNIIYTYTCVDT